MAHLHHRVAAELARVDDQEALTGIVHHGLGRADFAIVVVEQRAVVVDAVGTHDHVVDLELLDHVDRRHAGQPAILAAHHATGNDDFEVGAAGNDGGDIQVVGDDAQVLVIDDQLACDSLYRGADAHEQ